MATIASTCTNQQEQVILFAGSYTRKEYWVNGTGEGIYTFTLDANDGTLAPVGVTPLGINPMYVHCSTKTFSSGKRVLYAVDSAMDESEVNPETKTGFMSALTLSSDGTLKHLNTLETHGALPVHISLSPDEDFLVVSNYSGSVTMYPINTDGSLAPETFHQEFPNGSSVVSDRQESGHAHSSMWLPASNHVIIADLGSDELRQYELNAATQTLKPLESVRRPPGSGPHHLALHPSGRFAYVTDEHSNTVGVYQISHKSTLIESKAVQNVSTLPAAYTGDSSTTDIHLSSNGKFLYVSNRGHNSLSVFKIDNDDGALTLMGWEDTLGDIPWGFTIHGDWLIVANAHSGNSHVFNVDADTGRLEYTGNSYDIGTATCLCIAE